MLAEKPGKMDGCKFVFAQLVHCRGQLVVQEGFHRHSQIRSIRREFHNHLIEYMPTDTKSYDYRPIDGWID